MLHVCIALLIIASATALPSKNLNPVCKRYDFLYQQCIPPYEWVCPTHPTDFTVDYDIVKREFQKHVYMVNDVLSNGKCLYDVPSSYPYSNTADVPRRKTTRPIVGEIEYTKRPLCNAVRKQVEYVYRFIKDKKSLEPVRETCYILYSSEGTGKPVHQKIYTVSCHGASKKNPQCNLGDYAAVRGFYCKPTNLVKRTFVVYCPSNGGDVTEIQVKIPTSCSCVKVGCSTETSSFPVSPNEGSVFLPNDAGVGPIGQPVGPNQPGIGFEILDAPMNQPHDGPMFHPIEGAREVHPNQGHAMNVGHKV